MATFQLTIVTPNGSVFDGPVESVTAVGLEGSFGVLAHHAPMIAATTAGPMTIRQPEEKRFDVGAGVLEVSAAGAVTVLADGATPIDG